MDKDEEIVDLAKDIVDDAELKRVSVEALVLKASRLANLVVDEDIKYWLNLEKFGYSDKQPDLAYMAMTGRTFDTTTRIGLWGSIATQENLIDGSLAELEVVKSFKPTGTYSMLQFDGQVQRVKNLTSNISVYKNICSRVASKIQDFATTVYYTRRIGREVNTLLKQFSTVATEGISKNFPDLRQSFETIDRNIANSNPRGWSAAALECRNILINLSGMLWGSKKKDYICKDGDKIRVDKEKNKLIAYVDTKMDGTNEGKARTKKMFGLIHEIFTLGGKSKRKINNRELPTIIIDTIVFINDLINYTDLKPIK